MGMHNGGFIYGVNVCERRSFVCHYVYLTGEDGDKPWSQRDLSFRHSSFILAVCCAQLWYLSRALSDRELGLKRSLAAAAAGVSV